VSLYRSLARPLLFSLDPERAHALACGALRACGAVPFGTRFLASRLRFRDPALETEVAGIKFPNPVGLAAGFDKDCEMSRVLPGLGFGFLELGTVTLQAQDGNPRPRLFRLPAAHALVNRMGFNNAGADAAAARLASDGRAPVPVGVNIGINKDVGPEEAPARYAEAFAKLYPFGDYFAVNVSSPNTHGLRRLQDKLRLERILLSLQQRNGDAKPVFVKLAPDLSDADLEELLPVLEKNAAGVICANTTISPALKEDAFTAGGGDRRPPFQGGGLSGAPVREPSTRLIRKAYALTRGRLPIIGVGGIFTAEDAYQKIRAGASLVQVYTGLVYGGPALPGEICRGLARILQDHGLGSISEAVGKSHESDGPVPQAGEGGRAAGSAG